MIRLWLAALASLLALTIASAPAHAQALIDRCEAETCKARLTAPQLLAEVQTLVLAKRYDEAKPMLAALSKVETLRFETRFLTGYIAEQTGDYRTAEAMFRQILVDDPKQTRVRLELGRTFLAMGKMQSADHEFRLAAEDQDLPPEITRTIRSVRTIIRSKRTWTLNLDFGIAPDTNINNATGADSVTVLFGNQPIPLTLDPDAREKSGLGVTGSIDAGLRLPVSKKVSWLADFDSFGTQYSGTSYDDLSLEFASGPEYKISEATSIRIEALGAQRDFGARIASRQYGLKAGLESTLDRSQRIGIQIDLRRTDARFDHNYDGWQLGAYATYERVIARSMIASANIFVRRDALTAEPYSNVEVGGVLGIGGELSKGFNFGLSIGGSRALYDAPIAFFSVDPRHDWRLNARATLGNRAIRVLGFSPTVSATYGRNESSIGFYDTDRARFRFALARYF